MLVYNNLKDNFKLSSHTFDLVKHVNSTNMT